MRILVYPHDLNMGGSQTNAIELAAALRPLGVACTIFGRRGVLNARIADLGLEFVESVDPGRRPSPAVVRQLRGLVSDRGFDVVHAYEWPPTLDARLAVQGRPAAVVSTIMSMAVAPFIPSWVPLVVGTQQIAATERVAGRPLVEVLVPPVDLRYNVAPPADVLDAFRHEWRLDGRPLVVCVTRLAAQLKLEGLLTAIGVAGRQKTFQLLVVGDGPERVAVREAAARANETAGRDTVVLTGELLDPRPAYAVADIVLGMGGSALRALAFTKPLIVQGERGFFETLTPESLPMFRWQGWYGVGNSSHDGAARLLEALGPLMLDADLRLRRGAYGREVVEEFSLDRAAQSQLHVYREALAARYSPGERAGGDLTAAGAFLTHHAGRRWARWHGRSIVDDFNAAPVATAAIRAPARSMVAKPRADGTIIYFSGVPWHAVHGTDHQLALALSRHHPVLWVDTPQSVWARWRRGIAGDRLEQVAPGITRLLVTAPPAVTRPGSREISLALVSRAVRGWLRATDTSPLAWIASTTEPVLGMVQPDGVPRVYLATDDFVAAASLWKMSTTHLHRARETNVKHADIVLAVSAELAEVLRRGDKLPFVLPNGCDLDAYRLLADTRPAAGVRLNAPIAGVIGQFNERIDVSMLQALHNRSVSMLLVGPRYFASRSSATEFEELIQQTGVQWFDRVPAEVIGSYLLHIDVGLTPYADTAFNRRSFPLKTLDYLAAGVPVVSTDVPPRTGFDPRFVRSAATPEDFADAVLSVADERFDRDEVHASVAGFDWGSRADDLLALIKGWRP